jgi:hypothetical protein
MIELQNQLDQSVEIRQPDPTRSISIDYQRLSEIIGHTPVSRPIRLIYRVDVVSRIIDPNVMRTYGDLRQLGKSGEDQVRVDIRRNGCCLFSPNPSLRKLTFVERTRSRLLFN